ncbi:MAG TPA: DUF2723 domain-containing protein [Candidatus Eisenbacteria bacterium]
MFGLTAAAYLATVVRGIDYVDSGELAAVARTLGIGHPTGYPIFTLLGHLFTGIVPLRPILALNALAALLAAASAAVLVLLFDELLMGLPAPSPGPRLGEALRPRAMCAACAALATAFSGHWWDQARHYEVYSLHELMIALVTTTFVGFTRRGVGGSRFAYVLGLAFTNHMTTVLLAPGFLAYFALSRGLKARELKRLAGLMPWFLLGLTPYLYLPVRSRLGPRFDWGDPETLQAFLQHVTGREYRTWLFSSGQTFAMHTRYFFEDLPKETGYAGLLVALVGLAWLLLRAPRLALLMILLFVTAVVMAGGYGIMDIRPYYLVAMLALGLGIAAGLGWVLGRFGPRSALAAGVVLVSAVFGIQVRDQIAAKDPPVEGLARELLEPLPRDAVVLTSQWDQWLSASLYLQEVEGLRRDLLVVNWDLLQRPWYLKELARRAPRLRTRLGPAMDRVVAADAAAPAVAASGDPESEAAHRGMVNALVLAALAERPVFMTRDAVSWLDPALHVVPEGLAFRIVTNRGDSAQGLPRWRFRPERASRDMQGALTCELYARSALDRAYYEVGRGRDSTALGWLEYARTFDPGWRSPAVVPGGARQVLSRSLEFFDALRTLDLDGLRRQAVRAGLMPSSSADSSAALP